MKILIYLLFVLPLLIACSQSNYKEEKNIALVEKYVQAVENLDLGVMEELLADNYIGYGPSYGDSINKTDAIASWNKNVEFLYESIDYSRIQNATVVIKEGPNAGDWVSSWAELKINYKDGNKATIWANTAYRIVDDKIVKTFTFYNEADVLEQLGYVFINIEDL